MAKTRSVLGRGLDALIPTHGATVQEVRLDDIQPNASQPRTAFLESAIQELADSIRVHGVIQPLIVTPPDERGKRRLIAGERRWQAARSAGLTTVPTVERTAEEREAMEIALVENIQREDLSPMDQAGAFDRLARQHGLTQEEIALRVGRSRPSVANTLRLLSLPLSVRQALADGTISEGHARALLGLSDPLSIEQALTRVLADALSVRQTEQLVARLKEGHPTPRHASEKPQAVRHLERELQQALGTKVSVTPGRKIGRIVIEYYSDEELTAIAERLVGSETQRAEY